MSYIQIYSFSTLIYLVPGYGLYLLFILRLFKNPSKAVQTPFFGLIKLLGVIDLLMLPLFFYCYRVGHIQAWAPFFQYLSTPNISMTIVVYSYCVLQHSQFFVHLALAFNRLSAVVFPKLYEVIWNGPKFYVIAVMTILIPAIYMSWLLYLGGYMYYDPLLEEYMISNVNSGYTYIRKSAICALVAAISVVANFLMDITTLVLLRRHKRQLKINDKSYSRDIRLLAISIVLLAAHVLYLFAEIALFLFAYQYKDLALYFLFPLQNSTLDIYSLISPFCVIILNPEIRKIILPKKYKVGDRKLVSINNHVTVSIV